VDLGNLKPKPSLGRLSLRHRTPSRARQSIDVDEYAERLADNQRCGRNQNGDKRRAQKPRTHL
jgi:hypothetical protein